jgi:hypothetical protein
MRFSEPHILLTDGILSIQAIIFSICFFRAKPRSEFTKMRLFWIGYWISIWFFALSGTIKHFTTSEDIFNITSKLDVIGGCFGLFWLQLAIPETVIRNEFRNYFRLFLHASLSLAIFIVLLIISGWDFIFFGYYVLFVIIEFLIFTIGVPKIQELSIDQNLLKEMAIFLTFTFLFGLVFLVGRFKWLVYYGNENQYLLNIGNEIFHIGMMYPNFRIFRNVYSIL